MQVTEVVLVNGAVAMSNCKNDTKVTALANNLFENINQVQI